MPHAAISQPEQAQSPPTAGSPAVTGSLLDTRRIRLLLGRSPHSRTLPGDFLDRMASLGRIERYKGGELVHAAWQPLDKLWVVLTGGLRVAHLAEDGTALAIAVLGEGSYYGAGALVKAGKCTRSEAHTVGRTQLATFAVAQLEREFCNDKLMDDHRLELIYRRLSASVDLGRDLLVAPLPQRLARRLLGQALAAGRGPDIELRISQTDLAAMLGAGRSKVNAELRRLQASGALHLGYRMIVVRDLKLLRAAAGTEVMPL